MSAHVTRGRARPAPAGESRPCRHLRAAHQHGHYLAYLKDGCRCEPCTTAHRRQQKQTAYRAATGTSSYVPADRARAHTRRLAESLTINQIEARSGVQRTSIRALLGTNPGHPASRRITRTTERALLATTADRVADQDTGVLVDATGTIRRIRALAAIGYTLNHLARLTGISSLRNLATAPHDRIKATTRATVIDIYDTLAMTPAPPSRPASYIRNLARDRGWAPPLAWDDDTIDDPAATPTGTGPNRGHASRVPDLHALGVTPHEIAHVLGLRLDSVHRAIARATKATAA